MFLTFEFTKTFKLSLTACCVVLNISAYLRIFHDGEEEKILSCRNGEISKCKEEKVKNKNINNLEKVEKYNGKKSLSTRALIRQVSFRRL